MRVAALLFVLLAVNVAGISYLEHRSSVPVPVVELPKLAHHVVYFWVCDDFIGALLTTEPSIWSDVKNGVPPDDVVELMIEAILADHSIAIKHRHRDCPKLEMAPEELM